MVSSGAGRQREPVVSVADLDDRLHGDLDALSDFAEELSHLRGRSTDSSRGWNGPFHSDTGSETAAHAWGRINADPATVEQGLAKLILTLIELIRQLLEKQAMRRMDSGSLTDDEIERMGETFLKLQQRMSELKTTFGLQDEELNLSLGPLGNLLPED